jgi:hypothetical protein
MARHGLRTLSRSALREVRCAELGNAIVMWTTEYRGLAVVALCRRGRRADDGGARAHLNDPA